ncbi:MAG TPA: hypothetical protein PKV66_00785 [Candidatus Pelethenecus sp.]|nr:hypothetical protein [Candidatus Pelethenecus sp.]
MENKILEEIKNSVREIAERKMKEETEKANEKILREEEQILDICNKIQTGFWLKKVDDGWSYKYMVATIEEFKNDYFKVPKYSWQKGLEIKSQTEFIINDELYFHIGNLWENYRKTIGRLDEQLKNINLKIINIKKEKEEFEKSFKGLKSCLIDYQNLKEQEEGKLNNYGN